LEAREDDFWPKRRREAQVAGKLKIRGWFYVAVSVAVSTGGFMDV
jgi:hypothetical protein